MEFLRHYEYTKNVIMRRLASSGIHLTSPHTWGTNEPITPLLVIDETCHGDGRSQQNQSTSITHKTCQLFLPGIRQPRILSCRIPKTLFLTKTLVGLVCSNRSHVSRNHFKISEIILDRRLQDRTGSWCTEVCKEHARNDGPIKRKQFIRCWARNLRSNFVLVNYAHMSEKN